LFGLADAFAVILTSDGHMYSVGTEDGEGLSHSCMGRHSWTRGEKKYIEKRSSAVLSHKKRCFTYNYVVIANAYARLREPIQVQLLIGSVLHSNTFTARRNLEALPHTRISYATSRSALLSPCLDSCPSPPTHCTSGRRTNGRVLCDRNIEVGENESIIGSVLC